MRSAFGRKKSGCQHLKWVRYLDYHNQGDNQTIQKLIYSILSDGIENIQIVQKRVTELHQYYL